MLISDSFSYESLSQDLTRIETLEQCQQILEQHNWNLEAAVSTHSFDLDEEGPQIIEPAVFNPVPEAAGVRQRRTARNPISQDNVIEEPVVSNNNNQVGLIGNVVRLFSGPFTFFYDSLLSILNFAWTLIRGDPRRSKCLKFFFIRN